MTDLALKQQLELALRPAVPLDVQAIFLARVASGQLAIEPRRSYTRLRRLLLAAQAVFVLLNVVALAALVRALLEGGTFDFLNTAARFSEFRDVALQAALESLPTAAFALAILAFAALGLTFVVRSRLSQQHLLV